MDASKAPKEAPSRRVVPSRGRPGTGLRVTVWLSIVGTGVLLFGVMYLSSRSGHREVPESIPTPRGTEPPVARPREPAPDASKGAGGDDEVTYRKPTEPRKVPTWARSGEALNEAIDRAYAAAKRRSDAYASEGRWGKAITAMEQICDRFDSDELRMRCDPEIRKLRDQAKAAYNTKSAEADRLAKEGRYDDARKVLAGIAATFEREEYVEPAKERIQELTAREETEDAARYKSLIAAVNQKIPDWKLDEALGEISKLQFPKAKYKEMHAARLAEIRALVALRDRMIEKVNLSSPRLLKRTLRVPGLDGDLAEANAEGVVAETDRGREKFTWIKFGPEATLRLALLTGDAKDGQHHLAVGRLLMEVGYFRRAKQEIEKAKDLKVNTAADEAALAEKQKEGASKD